MSLQLFVGGIGGPELLIVFFLVVLLFGANKLPQLARSSGEAMGEFQKGRESLESDVREATSPTPTAGDATDAAVTDSDSMSETDEVTDEPIVDGESASLVDDETETDEVSRDEK